MAYNSTGNVFVTLGEFCAATRHRRTATSTRIVHCLNPFRTVSGSEHDRAQRVTLATMTQARAIARQSHPNLTVEFAGVTIEEDAPTDLSAFDIHHEIARSVLSLKDFRNPRPLPLLMDILTAPDVNPDDILIFTNVDIAVVAGFYAFIEALFARGADCAIVNRRTVSNAHRQEDDIWLMMSEVGEAHAGFDCFAFRGSCLGQLLPFDSCVGIGGAMLPLVHQLLAVARHPVVLLDAHASFHLGDDKSWKDDRFADYAEHNRDQIDRVFDALVQDHENRNRLIPRLCSAHKTWVFPPRLRERVGIGKLPPAGPPLGR